MSRLVPRQPMREQPAEERVRNFEEVALGYTEELARAEASRCLGCKKATCVAGCPVEVEIGEFIALVREGKYDEAIALIKGKNSLPAICGRVCPQETQCEEKCVLAKKGEPVAIGRLERFVADLELSNGPITPAKPEPTGRRVAVIGSGPGGLTCAADLARMGHSVTIFEALHKPGGVLRYGIPPFRLPRRVLDAEIDYVRSFGVEIRTNAVVGQLYTIPKLFEQGFEAVFVAVGAGYPSFLGIPGENLIGVYSANEFLTRVNLMEAVRFPEVDTPIWVGKRVAVVGGGNVAMDAARVARRVGSEVFLVYRRSEAEIPARREEVHHAKEEGINFHLLTNPKQILGDERGWVKALECLRMELGEPDASGRRRPVAVAGSEFLLAVETVVIAIGNQANPLLPSRTPGLETNRRGNIVADPETGATSLPGVYAGGDIVTGAATVIEAMGAGKRAARAINDYLSNHKGGR